MPLRGSLPARPVLDLPSPVAFMYLPSRLAPLGGWPGCFAPAPGSARSRSRRPGLYTAGAAASVGPAIFKGSGSPHRCLFPSDGAPAPVPWLGVDSSEVRFVA
ncbi:unnamed protein product [Lepidochelys kempii]